MRDPQRIQKYCNQLADLWRMVPDWRFAQLMINAMRAFEATYHRDAFYKEDEEFFQFLEKYLTKTSDFWKNIKAAARKDDAKWL